MLPAKSAELRYSPHITTYQNPAILIGAGRVSPVATFWGNRPQFLAFAGGMDLMGNKVAR
jgi:hypothetical protein